MGVAGAKEELVSSAELAGVTHGGPQESLCVVLLLLLVGRKCRRESVCHGLTTYRNSDVVVYTSTHTLLLLVLLPMLVGQVV
ncbi:hypothetical protein ASPBRDRAFT_445804 [Aspergillus brasiliensis CBS 101740]|uniref:Uncharacterized protein n=1 Tax=Aspergillus brasiliensis (strain CBS 101740 / IMI 381727 / IBT 21946) TaxID=767769 RepID=A0A1L9URH3_ASPBC|nr:hypothetical protein ASPBRDRAFT_445804 [Aspergillus brasiliensis CBS 101740]